jgi:hypothetical protein
MTKRYKVKDRYGNKRRVALEATRAAILADYEAGPSLGNVPPRVLLWEVIVYSIGFLVVTLTRLLVTAFRTHPKASVAVLIVAAIYAGSIYAAVALTR